MGIILIKYSEMILGLIAVTYRMTETNIGSAYHVVQDGKLFIFQDGAPVPNRSVWVL